MGFAIHKRYAHILINERSVPGSDGRLLIMDLLPRVMYTMSIALKGTLVRRGQISLQPTYLHDTIHPTQLICSYALTNLSPAATRNKFFSQLEAITTSNLWLIGDFNEIVGRVLGSDSEAFVT